MDTVTSPSWEQVPYPVLLSRTENRAYGVGELLRVVQSKMEQIQVGVVQNEKRSHPLYQEVSSTPSAGLFASLGSYHGRVAGQQAKSRSVMVYLEKRFGDLKREGEALTARLDKAVSASHKAVNRNKDVLRRTVMDAQHAQSSLDKAIGKLREIEADRSSSGSSSGSGSNGCGDEADDDGGEGQAGGAAASGWSMSSMFSLTPEQKHARQEISVEKRRAELRHCRRTFERSRGDFLSALYARDAAIGDATSSLERLDRDRAAGVKAGVSTFVKVEREELEVRLRELELVERAVEALDHPSEDLNFVAESMAPINCHGYGRAVEVLQWYQSTAAATATTVAAAATAASAQEQRQRRRRSEPVGGGGGGGGSRVLESGERSGVGTVKRRADSLVLELEDMGPLTTPVSVETGTSPGTSNPHQVSVFAALTKIFPTDDRYKAAAQSLCTINGTCFDLDVGAGDGGSDGDGGGEGEGKGEATTEKGGQGGTEEEEGRPSCAVRLTWRSIFADEALVARSIFLRELDSSRSRSAELSRDTYAHLANSLVNLLDSCRAGSPADLSHALRCANMCKTYYRAADDADGDGDDIPGDSGGNGNVDDRSTEEAKAVAAAPASASASVSASTSASAPKKARIYLQAYPRLCGHRMWTSKFEVEGRHSSSSSSSSSPSTFRGEAWASLVPRSQLADAATALAAAAAAAATAAEEGGEEEEEEDEEEVHAAVGARASPTPTTPRTSITSLQSEDEGRASFGGRGSEDGRTASSSRDSLGLRHSPRKSSCGTGHGHTPGGHDFWDLCLRQCLAKQMQSAFADAPNWLTLLEDPETLAETICSVHNLSFGQIGALAFAMEGLGGMDKRAVRGRVRAMAAAEQLSEDLVLQLMNKG